MRPPKHQLFTLPPDQHGIEAIAERNQSIELVRHRAVLAKDRDAGPVFQRSFRLVETERK